MTQIITNDSRSLHIPTVPSILWPAVIYVIKNGPLAIFFFFLQSFLVKASIEIVDGMLNSTSISWLCNAMDYHFGMCV